jgi:ubiquinone biosynthesis monooxygenase Coq7
MRRTTLVDHFIAQADQALRTLTDTVVAKRNSPAEQKPITELTETEKKHIAGLMRINHTGEVCAQALYQGQALTAKLPNVREAMEHAAQEEIDHLAWCKQRLDELNSHTSYLNPLWYGLSFSIGAIAGAVGDKWSLGFVAATEDQVCKHLDDHLQALPIQDEKSHAILQAMREDEAKHAATALDAGGVEFTSSAKTLMGGVAKLMTKTTYYL